NKPVQSQTKNSNYFIGLQYYSTFFLLFFKCTCLHFNYYFKLFFNKICFQHNHVGSIPKNKKPKIYLFNYKSL
ncbi:hypothetical protein DSH55_04895, partial [Enterococcus faecalis]|nr:hypothetical protein [Enterococcus faecalis]